MSLTKLERDKQKLIQDKCQLILSELLRDEDNKYCVDCDSKGPRWASWNLGIFLCIRCAGIHRNLGVHISKVKSVNLDSWTPEQVGSIQNMGNSKARAVYEANLPDNFTRPQADSALESFIRAKYEQKKYIAKEWVETSPKPAFDVEAELKKDKEKKKSKIKTIGSINAVTTDIQSNSIPRPTANINGKTTDKVQQQQQQSQQPSQPKTAKADSATTDLLGLDLTSSTTNNEPFGFFASAQPAATSTAESTPSAAAAPPASSSSSNPSKSIEEEEKDFFSQKVPEKSEEQKLTKESILSLYSKSANTNTLVNGFMAPQALPQTNPINQFPVNQPFGQPAQPNVMASTNPFLANSGNQMFGDFQSQNLIPSMSSLQLSSSSQLRGLQPNLPTAVGASVANTQLNWFSTGGGQTPAGGALMANAMSLPGASVANPFVDSSSSLSSTAAPSSTINMLNFNLKPSNISTSATTNPNPLLTMFNASSNNQKPNVDLNNLW